MVRDFTCLISWLFLFYFIDYHCDAFNRIMRSSSCFIRSLNILLIVTAYIPKMNSITYLLDTVVLESYKILKNLIKKKSF